MAGRAAAPQVTMPDAVRGQSLMRFRPPQMPAVLPGQGGNKLAINRTSAAAAAASEQNEVREFRYANAEEQ